MKRWSLITHTSLFFFILLLFFFKAFETLDYRSQDYLYQKEMGVNSDIIILAIDDDSLDKLGIWPWDRDYHAEIIRLIGEGKPHVIGYDIIFAEESMEKSDDDYLIQTAGQVENIIFPSYGSFADISKKGILKAEALSKPFSRLDEVVKTGHINTIMDNDGIVRKAILNIEYDRELINSFSWEIYSAYAANKGKNPNIDKIPLDSWNRTSIRYSGSPYDIERISAYKLLTGEIPSEYFHDKIVLVGPTAVGIADDYYFTPIAPQIPMHGVEIHANIINQFISERYFTELSMLGQIGIIMILAIVSYLILTRYSMKMGSILFAGLFIGFILLIKTLAGLKNGYIISGLYPIILIALQYITVLAEKLIREQLEKKNIRDVFGKYVAPQIVDKILDEEKEGLKLGGLRKNISVLFVDIRGFTSLSESLEPEEVVSILNEYLSLCAQAIFRYGGTLDKYIGDAVMAIYNAPIDLENHELRAVQTAWAMLEESKKIQDKIFNRFGRLIHFGVGIHTGEAIVGNIGADFRMDYTAIGDTVNTASRIEGNSGPGQILISREVYEKVDKFIDARDLGEIKVKGKESLIKIYQVDNVKVR